MKGLIIRWLINAGALWLIALMIKGIEVQSVMAALLAAAVLGIINAVLRPIFILLTLPINILTLGLFTLVINAAMLKLVSWLIPAFHVEGFWTAVGGALVISIISVLLNLFLQPDSVHVRVYRG